MSIISINNLSKTYAGGAHALRNINLDIQEGEIFGLLGPNGAGKTTLIGVVTGLVTKTSGEVLVFGKDVEKDYRFTRSVIGLVPQEIQLEIFLPVQEILENQRGFYGKPKNPKLVDDVLHSLSLWEKRHEQVRFLSGGMKRRVLIAKALMNEPKILFLDEPSAGVDVELRKDMWEQIMKLKKAGTTIILTTHYIEEAELLADRIGIINNGELVLVEQKEKLMKRMGEKTLIVELVHSISALPSALRKPGMILSQDGKEICYQYSVDDDGVNVVIKELVREGIAVRDMTTTATKLEEIFVNLIKKP